ncbi:MAG: citrate lyase subunit alpha [Clostridia bacterium]|nr:citrate lyase subunit alpha [Clostridia bacterium]
MRMNKLVNSIKQAVIDSGLKDGQTISFHHHLRNGDYVLNMVMEVIAELGIKNLTVNASSLFDTHRPLKEHIKNGVVTTILTDYMSAELGSFISAGNMANPVQFRTHGGRPCDIENGSTPIDVAFIAAPASDAMGNCTGKYGKSACGSLGYAIPDAKNAGFVVVITDELHTYPLTGWSIPETDVDEVVVVDSIGNPAGIVSGTTKITRDPVGLSMAMTAVDVIKASGLLKEGFSFQTGAGGASLAAAKYLKDVMLREKIRGSFGLGGITGYMVDMLNEGCFDSLMDVQCFDLKAVESIRSNPRHNEISATHYASPGAKSAVVDSLDVVILGATQIDTDFNINVHTDSNGRIMGGSGGHSDTAAGAKLSMIIAPLSRARLPIVTDHVTCVSTPGSTIDVLVTQKGVAVNPRNEELRLRLRDANIKLLDINELKIMAERTSGTPEKPSLGDRIVADIIYRDGTVIDHIRNVVE